MAKTAPIKITFAGDDTYTLTASYVASDAIKIDYANMAAVYVQYTPAATNAIVNFQIQVNPFDAETDPTGAYWSTDGFYVDASGQQQTNTTGAWITQAATYSSLGTSVIATVYTLVPVPLNVFKAVRIRIMAKETAGTSAGNVTFIVAKNDYN